MIEKISRLLLINLLLVFLLAGLAPLATTTFAQDEVARPPDVILGEAGEIPTVEAILELFINCSEWDEAHSEFQDDSRQALVDLGVLAVPTLLEHWLSSVDVRRRIELDTIVGEIGYPAAVHLLPYLQSEDVTTRRHAAYLLGDTSFAVSIEDPLALGPFDEDLPALQALVDSLRIETDWHVTQSFLSSIGKMRDPEQIAFIGSYLNNDEQAVRLSAVIALGRIPDQRIVSHTIGAFNDPVMNVRQAAVLAVSTETIGNLAFEALLGASVLSPGGMTPRLCALESLARYLDNIKAISTDNADAQRSRAYLTALSVFNSVPEPGSWKTRAFAAVVIGYTWTPEAIPYLTALSRTETHPLVLGKISEAIERLEAGLPVVTEP